MIEQRTGVSGVSQAEERVDCDNILHKRRRDQSEQQLILSSTLCMSQVWIFLCWKDNCPVCRCASCLLTQCTTGSSQRSISAMTRCHWRNEDDVAKRIKPHDVATEKRFVSWRNFISAKQRAVEWSSQGWRADTEISTSVKTVIEYSRSWKAVVKCSRSVTKM